MTRARGFTLLELMVGLSMGVLAAGLVSASFIAQQRAFQSLEQGRASTETARDATLELQGSLLRLGWGIDPRYAIDMRNYNCASLTGTCRDQATGSDELVFVARNANYSWLGLGVGGCATAGGCYSGNAWPLTSVSNCSSGLCTTVQTTLQAGDIFHKGRVLQFVCAGGTQATMGTVATAVNAAGLQTITLVAAVAGNPYKENALATAVSTGCFSATGAGIFLVDRSRYFVSSYSGVPWLMLDRGLDLNGDGTLPENGADVADYTPIVPMVEDMQVSWTLMAGGSTAPDAAGGGVAANWVVGDAPGVQEELNPTLSGPLYDTPVGDPTRFTVHPANARAARVSLVVRSAVTDQSMPASWAGDPIPAAENRVAVATGLGRYRRYKSAVTSSLRNLDSRSLFFF